MKYQPLIRFARTLKMPSGSNALPWAPSIPFKNDEYLAFTGAGGEGYTPDGFFHFFGPAGPNEHSLLLWNAPDLWRRYFIRDLDWYSVAEDAFGYQYCLRADGRRPAVKMVSLWSGQFTLVANSFSDFISDLIQEPPEAWQKFTASYHSICTREGMAFRPFCHLSPKIPPLLDVDGRDDAGSYEWMSAAANASILGQVFEQVRNLPPGTQISGVEFGKR